MAPSIGWACAAPKENFGKLRVGPGKSKGQLVREAISACYQPSLDELPLRQRQAVSAYQGGYISLGKLAREMGMHVLELRVWLGERDIPQQTTHAGEDAGRA
jgi:predicted HTH domain antitoxin